MLLAPRARADLTGVLMLQVSMLYALWSEWRLLQGFSFGRVVIAAFVSVAANLRCWQRHAVGTPRPHEAANNAASLHRNKREDKTRKELPDNRGPLKGVGFQPQVAPDYQAARSND